MIPVFKIRGSAGGQIMTDPQGKTPMEEYQSAIEELKRLGSIQAGVKDLKGVQAIARAQKIEELKTVTIPALEKNKNGVLLSATCITYCQIWLKEILYNRRKQFYSKQTDKGICCEPESIELAARVYDWGFVLKNEQEFEDEYKKGTPDIILAEEVNDLKNSYDAFTFPLFETKLDKSYEWQDRIYMDLTKKKKSSTIYTLNDAPEHIILMEAKNLMREAGLDEMDMELYDGVREQMTYSNLPDELRIKRFDVLHDDGLIDSLHDRVEKCRWHINGLIGTNKTIIQISQLKQSA